ncbi:hypothetical protein, partial [Serratia sp. 506_PEND]|uniref:hypothetical protein n=1 Tax=Serratia sp. 506_PEND TaxID=1572666 RepID=UPI00065FF178
AATLRALPQQHSRITVMKIFNKFELKAEKYAGQQKDKKIIYFNKIISSVNAMTLLPHRSNL